MDKEIILYTNSIPGELGNFVKRINRVGELYPQLKPLTGEFERAKEAYEREEMQRRYDVVVDAISNIGTDWIAEALFNVPARWRIRDYYIGSFEGALKGFLETPKDYVITFDSEKGAIVVYQTRLNQPHCVKACYIRPLQQRGVQYWSKHRSMYSTVVVAKTILNGKMYRRLKYTDLAIPEEILPVEPIEAYVKPGQKDRA